MKHLRKTLKQRKNETKEIPNLIIKYETTTGERNVHRSM
jgi:hypothetical protein